MGKEASAASELVDPFGTQILQLPAHRLGVSILPEVFEVGQFHPFSRYEEVGSVCVPAST